MSAGALRLGAALVLVATTAHAATIRGKVTILEKKGRSGDPSGAVVYLDGLPDGTVAHG